MLGFILGPMLEEYFRRAMALGHGRLMTFVEQPISATLLAATVLLVAGQMLFAGRPGPRPAAPTLHETGVSG